MVAGSNPVVPTSSPGRFLVSQGEMAGNVNDSEFIDFNARTWDTGFPLFYLARAVLMGRADIDGRGRDRLFRWQIG